MGGVQWRQASASMPRPRELVVDSDLVFLLCQPQGTGTSSAGLPPKRPSLRTKWAARHLGKHRATVPESHVHFQIEMHNLKTSMGSSSVLVGFVFFPKIRAQGERQVGLTQGRVMSRELGP